MQNKKIIRGVRIDNKVYAAGQEEALFATANVIMLTRLLNSGAIVGEWLPEAVPANDTADALKVLLPIGQDYIDELITAGYTTIDAINDASDNELKALPKIGAATVKKIRELLK